METNQMKILTVGLCSGLVFGTAFERSKVYVPDVIVGQMLFTNFIMMKMFFSAVATSTISLWVIERFGYKKRDCKPTRSYFGVKYFDSVVGGLILGVGMAITGSCPGTVYAQLGSLKVGSAVLTFTGAVIGAFVFGLAEPFIKKQGNGAVVDTEDICDKKTGITHKALAFVTSSVFFVLLAGLEMFQPWTYDLKQIGYNVDAQSVFDLTASNWHPAVAGILIGLLQIPSGIIANSHLGSSTSYCSFIGSGMAKIGITSSTFDYFLKVANKNFQKAMVIGVFMGAMVSASISTDIPEATQNAAIGGFFPNLIGGFLLLFGGRLANGCPTGHGITGMAQFNINSILSVASIFAGGIGMSMLYYK